ncbi:MAG: GNAT family N-acetyltransferase [Candidatus Latescibacterota bacterium]|nr:GNAT family N-acetyltransferase [Candidatus Latescibacterota bacterium]
MQLQTDHLLLRELTPDDWSAVLAYQSDPRYLRHYPWTQRSEQELSMRQEGRLLQREFVKGQWRDHLLYAILREEWNAQSQQTKQG